MIIYFFSLLISLPFSSTSITSSIISVPSSAALSTSTTSSTVSVSVVFLCLESRSVSSGFSASAPITAAPAFLPFQYQSDQRHHDELLFFNLNYNLRCDFQFYIFITQYLDNSINTTGSHYMISFSQGQEKTLALQPQLLLGTIHRKVKKAIKIKSGQNFSKIFTASSTILTSKHHMVYFTTAVSGCLYFQTDDSTQILIITIIYDKHY